MKRRITSDQLNELTNKQKENLRKWWKPLIYDTVCYHYSYEYVKIGCLDDIEKVFECEKNNTILPLLDIGQMIEILLYVGFCSSDMAINESFADKLWSNVKAALRDCNFD